jgi:hypothetical protein
MIVCEGRIQNYIQFLEFMKVSAYKNTVWIEKDKFSLRTSLHKYFIRSCEICTSNCTKWIVVCSRMASSFYFTCAFFV